jgi:pyrroloquinoline quinone biosynthesis protein D
MSDDVAFDAHAVPRISPRFRLQFEPVQTAWVLLYPEGMVKLSASAAEILRRVDGVSSVEAMIGNLEQAFPGAELRNDVLNFLAIAGRHGWIVV